VVTDYSNFPPHLCIMETNLKAHWETVFATKQPHEVSWTQETPETSISYFQAANLPKTAKIIDVGGGDSKFVDYLLANDYEDITVLDISKHALDRAKARLGEAAHKVTWIESDINDFKPSETYDFWHDRAAFHFLTDVNAIQSYAKTVAAHADQLVIGTFSVNGPLKCSGLTIQQYDETSMKSLFEGVGFSAIACEFVDHKTPSGAIQNFIFCSFKR
jgi:ubiquinone/menaquinone biosynthesis C-methylase UbiE